MLTSGKCGMAEAWAGAALVLAASLLPVLPLNQPPGTSSGKRPLIIAHRGASGMRPEHTLAAYELAIEQGADFIEPDLVSTRDGILVARHENEISTTTNVAQVPEFENRKRVRIIDGVELSGWFTEDFTLAELKTLKARERLPLLRPESAKFDGRFQIPTFQEILDLAKRKSAEKGRVIGVYPETKHPYYFKSIGLPLEKPLVEALKANGLTGKDAPVYIQSFEVDNLKQLKAQVETPLIQLISSEGAPFDQTARGIKTTYASMVTPEGLARIAEYARGIGPEKTLIITRGEGNSLGKPTTLVADAHRAGLLVHPWTFRSENVFLPQEMRKGEPGGEFARRKGDYLAEYRQFQQQGVDGFFSDYPADALEALSSTTSGAAR